MYKKYHSTEHQTAELKLLLTAKKVKYFSVVYYRLMLKINVYNHN